MNKFTGLVTFHERSPSKNDLATLGWKNWDCGGSNGYRSAHKNKVCTECRHLRDQAGKFSGILALLRASAEEMMLRLTKSLKL